MNFIVAIIALRGLVVMAFGYSACWPTISLTARVDFPFSLCWISYDI